MFSKLYKKHKRLILIILITLVGFFFFSNRHLSEQEFWNWFNQNSDKYYEELIEANGTEDFKQQSFTELGDKLRQVNKNLTFQFGLPDPKTKKAELVISADGIIEGIPAVQKLVKSAPKYDKWNIVAFRQREKTSTTLEFDGIKLGLDDIYFKATDEGEKTGIDFFIRNYDGADKRYIGAMFILLDNTLGEYDVMTRIGTIEIHTLDEAYMQGLKPLKDLPKLIDSKK